MSFLNFLWESMYNQEGNYPYMRGANMPISKRRIALFFLFTFVLLYSSGCSSIFEDTPAGLPPTGDTEFACQPTRTDMLGPFYESGAPVRDKVGEGYLLNGEILSAVNCSPIRGALIEFWMAGPDGDYTDDYRAVVYSGEDGSFHFESHFPPPYSGRPPHIHIRVTAEGYRELVTQHYPQNGTAEADFDLVLVEY
jgi:hypothetical protein